MDTLVWPETRVSLEGFMEVVSSEPNARSCTVVSCPLLHFVCGDVFHWRCFQPNSLRLLRRETFWVSDSELTCTSSLHFFFFSCWQFCEVRTADEVKECAHPLPPSCTSWVPWRRTHRRGAPYAFFFGLGVLSYGWLRARNFSRNWTAQNSDNFRKSSVRLHFDLDSIFRG